MTETRTRTILDWTPETRSLLRRLKREGFTLTHVSDGDTWEKVTSERQAIDVLTAADIGYLRVTRGEEYRSTLQLVYGNSPGELVSDWSYPSEQEDGEDNKAMDRVTDAHMAAWEERKQPTKEVTR